MRAQRTSGSRIAFTLVELLVVIAIIGIVVVVLLPSLRSARESGRTVVCLSNVKQIGVGLHGYAGDFKGAIWEAGTDLPAFRFWYAQPANPALPTSGESGANPTVVGPAFGYLSNVDRIFGCPSNQRKSAAQIIPPPNDPYWQTPQNRLQVELFNQFLTPRNLNFDYTMVTGSSGARVDSGTKVIWSTQCRTMTAQSLRPAQPSTASIVYFKSLPVFFEEDTEWWNARSPDGLFSNFDQVTDRHGGKDREGGRGQGHVLYLTGDVGLFKAPRGPLSDSQSDQGDMVANDIYAQGAGGRWFPVAPSWPGTRREYGWFNRPR